MPALDESDVTIVDRQGNDAGFGSLTSTGLGDNAHEHFAKRKALRASSHTLTDCVLLYEEVNAREEGRREATRERTELRGTMLCTCMHAQRIFFGAVPLQV